MEVNKLNCRKSNDLLISLQMVCLKPLEASESLTEGLTHQPSGYQKSSAVVRSVWADQPALLQQLICKLLVETGKVSPAVESVAATVTPQSVAGWCCGLKAFYCIRHTYNCTQPDVRSSEPTTQCANEVHSLLLHTELKMKMKILQCSKLSFSLAVWKATRHELSLCLSKICSSL
ncbi:hypothetical protein AMECASPLE_033394 [Ameca splendens]|uniref:Uncharacterized protein n=1 Tax=Ameca splendens TaxID=208324 RepID=A0ABV0Z5P8_9TELE